jgi:hypothetical protein
MRPYFSLCFVFVAGLATGCTELDDPPVEFDYQVRCVGCEPMAPHNEPHEIAALNGDDGLETGCTSEDGLITMGVALDLEGTQDDWGFRLDKAAIGEDGPGNACQVNVKEGSSEYRGACTADEPSAEAPCQVKLTREDAIITGTIFCDDIPNRVEQTITRNVTRPRSDTKAFKLEIQNCKGL